MLKQVLWNSKVEELGLAALGVETRYPRSDTTSDDRAHPDVVLTWNQNDIPDMGCVEDKISQKEAEWLSAWGCQELSEANKYELLALLENSYPGLARGSILDNVREDNDEKKTQILQLLKEKIIK